jgi:hypothetical protein
MRTSVTASGARPPALPTAARPNAGAPGAVARDSGRRQCCFLPFHVLYRGVTAAGLIACQRGVTERRMTTATLRSRLGAEPEEPSSTGAAGGADRQRRALGPSLSPPTSWPARLQTGQGCPLVR